MLIPEGLTMTRMNHDRMKPVPFILSACLRLLGSTLTLALSLFPLALPSFADYVPPPGRRPPSTATSTTGRRNGGLMADSGLQPTLLAPQQHVGQSQLPYPTFEWFVPGSTRLQGEFQLYEIIGTGEISETDDLQGEFRRVLAEPHRFVSQQGFMSFTLPENVDALKPNTQYIWQVLLRYGPRASDVFIMRSQIEIVEDSTSQQTVALGTPIGTTQVQQLAEAGLWYDALALTAQLPPSEATVQRNSLLLALAELEANDDTANDLQTDPVAVESITPEQGSADVELSHSEALRQIAEWQSSTARMPPRTFTANLPPT